LLSESFGITSVNKARWWRAFQRSVAILDRLIAVVVEWREEYRQELIREIAARAESSIYTDQDLAEDIEGDVPLRVFDKMLEDATILRKKVMDEETC
jgi:hypothetical protein